MPIDARFDELDDDQWKMFVKSWLAELGEGDDHRTEVSDGVTYMKFLARPEHLWRFIEFATIYADNDYQLGHIAAGLVERLLGAYGKEYIDLIAERVHTQPKFGKIITGVRRHTMSDGTWDRVKSLQSNYASTLPTDEQRNQIACLHIEYRNNLRKALSERTDKT